MDVFDSIPTVKPSHTSLVDQGGFIDPDQCQAMDTFDWYQIFNFIGVDVPEEMIAKLANSRL